MVNSIKSILTEKDTISELKLLLPVDKKRSFILLEGEDDVCLLRPYFREKVMFIKSYGSKNGIEKLLSGPFSGENRVIGIRDKDYQETPLNEQIFYYDYSCCEMMILSQNKCFEKICSNLYKGDLSAENLLHFCLDHLEFLAKLRKYNEIKRWNIKFDGIKVNKLFDKDKEKMNKNIIEELNKQNPKNKINEERLELVMSDEPCSTNEDYLEIINGHDFENLFLRICGNISKQLVAKIIKTSFDDNAFKNTRLYNNLSKYQQRFSIDIV